LTLIALPIRCNASTLASGAIVLGVALAAAPTAALAEAQVRGSPEAVTIEAKNTSVEEILAALSSFDVHYRSSANLQARLTGNYEGSLTRVMKRVLDGYSYFVKTADGRMDITVLDTPRTALATGAPPVRVVGRPQDDISAQSPYAQAAEGRAGVAVEPSVTPPSPAAPSAEASPSFQVAEPPPYPAAQAGERKVGGPAQPSPAAAVVDPRALPASPAAPSSRKRDHLLAAGGTETRPLPPRRIKMASGPHRWKKSHHAWRTRLAHAALCSRRISSFDWPMIIPVSSYSWLENEQARLRSIRVCKRVR